MRSRLFNSNTVMDIIRSSMIVICQIYLKATIAANELSPSNGNEQEKNNVYYADTTLIDFFFAKPTATAAILPLAGKSSFVLDFQYNYL